MSRERLPLLVAYRDQTLSVEAAEQLVSMSEDKSLPTYEGVDLPTADRDALLRKAAQLQEGR